MLTLIYNNVDLNKLFDIFQENLINYAIKELKKAEDVLMLIQDLKDPNYFFKTKKTKGSNSTWIKVRGSEGNIGLKSKEVHQEGGNNWFQHEQNLWYHLGKIQPSTTISING